LDTLEMNTTQKESMEKIPSFTLQWVYVIFPNYNN
jgi:hypothetical protein